MDRTNDKALVKICAPRLGSYQSRERLFCQLDRAYGRASLIWVSAPGGYGKTVLIASYLAERSLPHLWYQIDSRDADIATLFQYLKWAAARLAPEAAASLPALGTESRQGGTSRARSTARPG